MTPFSGFATFTTLRSVARFFCIFLFFALPCAAQTPRRPLEPAILDNRSFAEMYTLTAHLNDRTFLQMQMVVTNIGLGDQNAACKILLLDPDGKSWKANRHFGRKKWGYSATPNPVLSIGSFRLALFPDRTTVSGLLDGLMARIQFGETLRPVKPPNTDFPVRPKIPRPGKTTDRFYEGEILIPWSMLQAVLVVPGKRQEKSRDMGCWSARAPQGIHQNCRADG